jgi:PKD repeat protein
LTTELIGEDYQATMFTDEFFQVGFYNLRGSVVDTEQHASDYYYLNGTLEIKNNLPQVLQVSFLDDATEVLRNEEVALNIIATDKETPQAFLAPYAEVSVCGDEDWELVAAEPEFMDDYWEIRWTPETDREIEDYCFMVYVEDETSDRSLYHMTDEISVLNNKPEVTSIAVSETEVLRTQTVILTIKGNDVEDEGKDLTLEVNYKQSGNWEAAYISDITYETSSDSWQARFNPPKNARTGLHSFSARLVDSDDDSGEWFEPTDVKVDVQNNDPVAVIKPLKTMTATKSGTFDASDSSDVEDIGLTYEWDFGDKKKAKGLKATHAYAKEGKYKVVLTVTDSDNGKSTAETYVTVNKAPVFGGGGGGSTALSSAAIAGIAGAVILVVIIIMVLIMVMRRRASKTEFGAAEIQPTTPPSTHPSDPLGPPTTQPEVKPPPGPPTDVKYQVEEYKMYDNGPVVGQKAYGEGEKEKFYK